jgi:hypothetical protein
MADLYDLAVEQIRTHDYVTIAEIIQLAEEAGIPTEGDIAILPAENCCLWAGCSEELAAAIGRLVSSDSPVRMVGTSSLTYRLDGQSLRLPIAKKIRPYKELRWLPVCFRPG